MAIRFKQWVVTKKSLLFRLGAIAYGCILALLLVEVGFRISGSLLLVERTIRNRQGLSDEGTYRILCLGESTTQQQWPPFLQEELDKLNIGVKFKVIDEGKRGTRSAVILSRLDDYLNTFKPHMVVVMMGINDGQWIWKNSFIYDNNPFAKVIWCLKSMRLNKLATYLRDGLKDRALNKTKHFERENSDHDDVVFENADKLINIDSNNPNAYNAQDNLNLGKHYYLRGYYDIAERAFETAIKTDPKDRRAYVELANLCYQNREYERAKQLYATAIRIAPKNPDAYIGLGKLYFLNGEFQEAENVFEAGAKANPINSWLFIVMGNMYHQKGKLDNAEKLYETAINANPRDQWVYGQLMLLYEEKLSINKNISTTHVENLFSLGIKADPQNQWPYVGMGDLYRRKGDLDKAENYFIAGITKAPENPEGYIELGNFYNFIGAFEKAETIYKAGIKTDPKNEILYSMLGNLYRKNGDNEKAVILYKLAIKANPLAIWNYIVLGDIYHEMGLRERMEDIYTAALKDNPHNPWLHLELGKLYLKSGETEKAKSIFKKGHLESSQAPEMQRAMSIFPMIERPIESVLSGKNMSFPPMETIRNYRKLRDRVLKSGTKLVCMQYPNRNVKILKEILGTDKGILYIENRATFIEAIETHLLTDIFVDMFAGDFGHCTDFGNQLIARNVTKVILQEVNKIK